MRTLERLTWAGALMVAIGAAAGFYAAFEQHRCPCPRYGEVDAVVSPDVEAILKSYGL